MNNPGTVRWFIRTRMIGTGHLVVLALAVRRVVVLAVILSAVVVSVAAGERHRGSQLIGNRSAWFPQLRREEICA